MSDLLQTVAAYVPPSLVRATVNEAVPIPPTEPQVERFPAAVLFADVSGFTPLTEALGQKGSEGPEELTRLLNRYFSWMIAFAEAESGEVVKFGGDALTVIFSAKRDSLGVATRRAMQSAQTMQLAMQEFGIIESSVGLVTLKMKIGIGAGEILYAQVGGVDDRWEYIIAGDPLRQTAEAEKQAKKGEIVLSPEADAVIALHALPLSSVPQFNWAAIQNSDKVAAVLRCYTPKPVRTWLEEGLHSWLATLRPMSVLFVGVNGLAYEQPNAIDKLHNFLQGAQEIIYHYQGSLPRLTVDDKGTVLLILFGAPPYSHEDDPERALRCALDLQNLAKNQNLKLAIGVTTGRVFAGPVGSTTRREYTVMGNTVNLAAHMMVAIGPGQVCCSYETYRSARGQMSFEPLPPVKIKGKASAITIYRPIGDDHLKWQFNQITQAEISDPLVGRQIEMDRLASNLDKVDAGYSRILIIEGVAGIGKSKLVEASIRLMQERNMAVLLGKGRSINQNISYRAWQDIYSTYFDLKRPNDISSDQQIEQQQQIQAHISKLLPEFGQYAPLLNNILKLNIPENEFTSSLDPTLRQKHLSTLLLTLLETRANEQPLVLILEDAQWLDPYSWELVLTLSEQVLEERLPLLLMLIMRPLEGSTIYTKAKTLVSMDNIKRLRLESLPPEETLTLAVKSMGLTSNELPESVAELMRIRAGGNPFFAEELFYYLYHNEFITFKTIKDKTRCLIDNDLNRAAQTLPATIQSIILSRIDQLPPEKQLMLKVAAVIGQSFAYKILFDTLNKHMEVSESQLKAYLADLVYLGLIQPDRASTDSTYGFKHVIIREVTYQSLLFDRRRQLHRTVAMWYEGTFGQTEETISASNANDFSSASLIVQPEIPRSYNSSMELISYYSLLVYHWHQAEDDEREQHYAALLGRQAVAQFANNEAVGYINRALDLTPESNLIERYNLLLARETVYDRRGQRDVQLQDLAALTKLIKEMKDDQRGIVVTLRQASYAESISNYTGALESAQKAAALARQIGDKAGESKGCIMWGKILLQQGNHKAAQGILEQALSLARAGNSLYDEADVLYSLAYADYRQGDYSKAQTQSKESLKLCRAQDYPLIEAQNLHLLGLIYYQLSNYQTAQEYFEQTIPIYYAIGDRGKESKPFYDIGRTHLKLGNYIIARDYFEQALDINREVGDRQGIANILSNLGMTYCKLGDFTIARSYIGQSLGIYKEIGNQIGEASALSKLGFVYYSLGSSGTTKRYCELALVIQQKVGDRKGESYSLTYLGHALADLGQLEVAVITYHKALELHTNLEQIFSPIDIMTGLAYVSMLQGKVDQAIDQVEEILALIETNGTTGIDNLFWVYLKCIQVLDTFGQDTPATIECTQTVIAKAYATLQEYANHFGDKTLQSNFLLNIKTHQDIVAFWAGKKPLAQQERKHSDKSSQIISME